MNEISTYINEHRKTKSTFHSRFKLKKKVILKSTLSIPQTYTFTLCSMTFWHNSGSVQGRSDRRISCISDTGPPGKQGPPGYKGVENA